MDEKVSVREEKGAWVVRMEKADGRPQEFLCATEPMARQLASALSRPRVTLPPRASSR